MITNNNNNNNANNDNIYIVSDCSHFFLKTPGGLLAFREAKANCPMTSILESERPINSCPMI